MEQRISIKPPPRQDPASQPSQQPANSRPQKNFKEWYSTLAVIILAPIIALLLTAFVFQSYEVDGPSMETTLSDNDRLIVNKTSRTWHRIFGQDFIPDRYEIVVFNHYSSGPGSDTEQKQLIKRVIGLPGDRIVVRGGKVTVYNDEHPDGFLVDEDGPEVDVIDYTDGDIEQIIQPGEVFVMGDNRINSLDSRTFGAIPSKDIVGTLAARIYPINEIEKF